MKLLPYWFTKTKESKLVELKNWKDSLEKLYEQDIYASIINYGEYDGHTQVMFVNSNSDEKVVATPVGKKELITVAIGDNGREIRFISLQQNCNTKEE